MKNRADLIPQIMCCEHLLFGDGLLVFSERGVHNNKNPTFPSSFISEINETFFCKSQSKHIETIKTTVMQKALVFFSDNKSTYNKTVRK